jgi:hypothetical protein
VALAGPGYGADDVGQERFRSGIAVDDGIFAALLVVEDDLDRDAGAARPLRVRRRAAIADEVAGIGFAHEDRSRRDGAGSPQRAAAGGRL